MELRRFRLHCIERIDDRRQLLVLDDDPLASVLGRGAAGCRHRRDRFADEADLLGRGDGRDDFRGIANRHGVKQAATPSMRGTVLLLGSDSSRSQYVQFFRTNGLIVHDLGEPSEAVTRLAAEAIDVIVGIFSPTDETSVVTDLRREADRATSIIVTVEEPQRAAVRAAGADLALPSQTPPDAMLYEIHRALILRRSGRRLPSMG